MRYKLVGFENVASSIVANMTKALQRRIELICEILTLTGGEEMWRDVNITFTRNLPVNTLEAV
jgi:SPP1 family phage portal protein